MNIRECFGFKRLGCCSALEEQICTRGKTCPFLKSRQEFISNIKNSLEKCENEEYKICLIRILKEYNFYIK